ncbi:hypothetical protein LCI18_005719 [Fusarium solani-melongenae]|uniref:Uncharacterized protein n=1 Tax=Fusarium solani subsp. cucurbitae TaxID=2747967 RepID=A0ACD3Z0P5_FUSSC|nr:hypothetical protein LCI18_005719 [Fusarium solani-melongenae]
MKFTTVASVLTMAATAITAPTKAEARGGGSAGSCNANAQQVCCSGLLNCVAQVLGKNCDGSAYCCQTSAPDGTLVNIALLNCVDIL